MRTHKHQVTAAIFTFDSGLLATCQKCQKRLSSREDRIFYTRGCNRWDLCYCHVVEISNTPNTYFQPLPVRMAADFDLATYLNQTVALMVNGDLRQEKDCRTIELIVELLDIGKLWWFIGNINRLYSGNLSQNWETEESVLA